jgi:hypothetical protein
MTTSPASLWSPSSSLMMPSPTCSIKPAK